VKLPTNLLTCCAEVIGTHVNFCGIVDYHSEFTMFFLQRFK